LIVQTWGNTVKLTVTDACNNTATCNATVTLHDITAPSLTGEAYSQVGSVNTCKPDNATAAAAFSSANALTGYSDVCSATNLTAVLTNTSVAGNNCSWTITYTYDVKDESLNTLSARTYTTVGADATAPSGTAPAGTNNINACYINGTTPPVGTPAFDCRNSSSRLY
jgi:hypothetical protein